MGKPTAVATAKQSVAGAIDRQLLQGDEAALQQKSKGLKELFEKYKGAIQRGMLRDVKPDYVIATAMTAIRTNPDLLKCTSESLLAGLLQSVQLGLRLDGPLGHAYLIPFRNSKRNTTEAVFLTGYRGYIDLAYRSPKIKVISADVVREGDEFVYSRGVDEKLHHVPSGDESRPITHAYAYAKLTTGGFLFTVLTATQIEKRRAMSSSANSPAWKDHKPKMYAKTAVRDLVAYLPMAVELGQASAMEEAIDAGENPLELSDEGLAIVGPSNRKGPVQAQYEAVPEAPPPPPPVEESPGPAATGAPVNPEPFVINTDGLSLPDVKKMLNDASTRYSTGEITEKDYRNIVRILQAKRDEIEATTPGKTA